jgi:hypothetical protein
VEKSDLVARARALKKREASVVNAPEVGLHRSNPVYP